MTSIGWARNIQKLNNQDQSCQSRFTCRADRDYVWRQRRHLEGSNFRMAEDLQALHVREIRKKFLGPALKKAKEVANVKASIVGGKLIINGLRYTFNEIPTQWCSDQVQQGNQSFRPQVVSPTGRFAYTKVDSPTHLKSIRLHK